MGFACNSHANLFKLLSKILIVQVSSWLGWVRGGYLGVVGGCSG